MRIALAYSQLLLRLSFCPRKTLHTLFLVMATYRFVDQPDLEINNDLQDDVLIDHGPDLEVLEHEDGINLFTRNANRLKKK